jgi:hypothetical protein
MSMMWEEQIPRKYKTQADISISLLSRCQHFDRFKSHKVKSLVSFVLKFLFLAKFCYRILLCKDFWQILIFPLWSELNNLTPSFYLYIPRSRRFRILELIRLLYSYSNSRKHTLRKRLRKFLYEREFDREITSSQVMLLS